MLKKLFLLISFFFTQFLHSNIDPNSYQLAVTTSEPSANVADAVNVITGDYFIHEPDFIVQGAEPIVIDPIYISKNSKRSWAFLNHLYIEHFMLSISIQEPSGAILRYTSANIGFPKHIKNNKKQSDENRKVYNQKALLHKSLASKDLS
ncbi:MAG: hypothetical protein K940chlam5_00683 [Candidatus Anoxychlamydiales bacterium]|nr:hypothetical protein [Candidatus Anoxychlamydiales bacterium]